MADANERLARVQQVKRWRLLPAEWTAEGEELTPTFKLRRRVVHAKYADVIDALYADWRPGWAGSPRLTDDRGHNKAEGSSREGS